MKTALDTPPDALDHHEADFVANIREHTWFRTSVFRDDEGPGFSYTTGYWVNIQYPEVIVFSLKAEQAHAILWDVYRDLKTGRRCPTATRVTDLFGKGDAYLFPVAKQHYYDHLGWSRWFYEGDEFPCLQLVWPDRKGIFPWQSGFADEFKESQPDLSPDGWIHALGH